jgi:hypothetical protein
MSNKDNKDGNLRTVKGKDKDGNEVTVLVKKPSVQEYRDSQIEYNKTFRSALESGALLKKKLNDYMREQGIWDDEKEAQYNKFVEDIGESEKVLEQGGIPLKKARNVALKLRELRNDFRSLIAERSALDSNTAEGQADNARFNALVALCILNSGTEEKKFKTMAEYDKVATEEWASKAASELAGMIYELDPDYDKNLTENQFLVDYSFADDELRLINSDGHLIDIDEDGAERLVDENGRFVAYNEDGEQYFINRDGEEVNAEGKRKVAFSNFLDDDGKPVPDQSSSGDTESGEEDTESEEETTEEASQPTKPRGRPKKNTQNA